MYTALVLDKLSRDKLKSTFDWLKYSYTFELAHHMTLNLGPCKDPSILGKEFFVKVDGYGHSDSLKVSAVFVDTNLPVESGKPHVTLFVHESSKPSYSLQLEKKDLFFKSQELVLKGTVQEVESEKLEVGKIYTVNGAISTISFVPLKNGKVFLSDYDNTRRPKKDGYDFISQKKLYLLYDFTVYNFSIENQEEWEVFRHDWKNEKALELPQKYFDQHEELKPLKTKLLAKKFGI